MTAPSDIQAQLRSLSIAKDQRPVASTSSTAAARVRMWVVLVLVVGGLSATGIAIRHKLGAAGNVAAPGSAEKAGVKLVTVVAGHEPDPAPVITATGKIVSDHRVAVSTKVSGQIVALRFEQGDRVESGQLLARVEDVLYRARRDEAAARLQKSLANWEYQKINFARVSGLIEQESAPSIEFSDARRWLDDAEAQVAADRATLAFAEKTLADCEVVAPIAGVVLDRNVEVGDFVAAEGGRGANANAQFAVIADMTKLRVEVDISELDIIRVHDGMPCVITPDAYKDRRYAGHVMWIDPGANYSKATVQVKVRIEEPDEYLRVEGSAQVAFLHRKPGDTALSDNQAGAIWIPKSACLSDSGGETAAVFVAVDGRLRRVPITVGRRVGEHVEVLGGLSAGQLIAAEGVGKLTDGQSIRG